jgi:arylsulfatase A-like enzyme
MQPRGPLIDTGSSGNWDSHKVDRPIAGLIADLEHRGMLDDTLVVWTTELGRTHYHEQPSHAGREHHHQVFSAWLAAAA